MTERERDDISEEELANARRLLALTEIIDRYPQVVNRRVTGIIYILIGGGISFATLVMFVLAFVYQPSPWNPILNLTFVGTSLLITWIIAFRLVGPLTRSMPKLEAQPKPPRWFYFMWGAIGIILAMASVFLFTQENQLGFPILVQCVLALGQLANYYLSTLDPQSDGFAKENLAFGITAILSIPFMLIIADLAYLILIIVDIGGIYVLGVYALITAEKLLLETSGRG
jgi:hypothetical protein